MPRMNCTIKKTKNASVARNFGRIKGTKVFTQPSALNTMYCGTTTTYTGSIKVINMIEKNSVLKRNLNRAKAYAAREHANRLPATAPTTTMVELTMYCVNG